jgi:hypothetical protein
MKPTLRIGNLTKLKLHINDSLLMMLKKLWDRILLDSSIQMEQNISRMISSILSIKLCCMPPREKTLILVAVLDSMK